MYVLCTGGESGIPIVIKCYKDRYNGKGVEELSLESWLRKLNDKEPLLQRQEQPYRQTLYSAVFEFQADFRFLTLAVIS